MKLWLLRPVEALANNNNDDPWNPWYDKAFGFVARAETATEARAMAHAEAGDENRGIFMGGKIADTKQPWKDAKYSTCVELTAEGDAGLVIKDFRSA